MFLLGRKKRELPPAPPEWEPLLRRYVPGYRLLSGDERLQLGRLARRFVEEKNFEAAAGLQMTEEMRVAVAGQAALLVLNRPGKMYPLLGSVVLYPRHYVAPYAGGDMHGVAIEGEEERVGESWNRGTVVLSWEEVREGPQHPHDGFNVVLHEFAHQLDAEDGSENGTPPLASRADRSRWAKVMTAEMERLRREEEGGIDTLLDPYGAENEAEFFAVITETFFELPRELREEHPELYAELASCYGQDPAARATGEAQ